MTKMKNLIALCGLCLAVALVGCEDGDGDSGGGEPGGGASTPTGALPQDPGTGDGAAGSGGETSGGGGDSVSLGAPAMCSSGDDCPAGIECVLPAGGSVGFCNVDEMQASGGADDAEGASDGSDGASDAAPISLGAPAPCTSDADCGEHTCYRAFDDDEMGFCDVAEMHAAP